MDLQVSGTPTVHRTEAGVVAGLESSAVEAYNRFTLASDTTIAGIAESQTSAFWDAERGTREVVRSQRETANLNQMTDTALPAAMSVSLGAVSNVMLTVTAPERSPHHSLHLTR